MMQHPLRHWLSIRIRAVCITVFIVGTLLPTYIPKEALANPGQEYIAENNQFQLVEDGFLMKSSSLTKQGSRRAFAEGIIHIVRPGETIKTVSEKYRIKPTTLAWANSLEENEFLKSGQELLILPVDGVLHTVTRGQTLSRIAELFDIPSSEIAAQNDIQGGFIVAGQELIIPGAKPIIDPPPVQVAQQPSGQTVPKPATGTPSAPARPTPASPGKATATATPSGGTFQMPCNNCNYTQYYHAGHYAVDIQTPGSGPIFAAEAGTIIRADSGWNGGYGNVVEVDHGNGVVTLYAHNKELYVKVGDTVARGQQIAWMGNTGRVYGKTGIHVHFEVRVSGVKKNPVLYLK